MLKGAFSTNGPEPTFVVDAANGIIEPDVIDAAKSANDRYWV